MKERIIGAIVLVAVVVLVVPVFLDGPPSKDEMRTEHITLPGQSEQKTQTVVLARDRDEPVPAKSNSESPPPEAPPAEQTAASDSPPTVSRGQVVVNVASGVEATPGTNTPETMSETADEAPAKPEAAQTTSATGMWAVQLGSFSDQKNAENLAANLRKQGFAAFLSQRAGSDGLLHRVRIGPQKDRDTAEAMSDRLKKAGHSGQVVPHP